MIVLDIAAYLLFLGGLGYYTITTLQWYSYRLNRVVFHHTKPIWNLLFFLLPYLLYEVAQSQGGYGWVVALGYLPWILWWYRHIDKKLVFTARVKRFIVLLYFAALFLLIVFGIYSLMVPLLVAYLLSLFVEKMLFEGFRRRAKEKLDGIEDLVVVGVTASYGKTSIKRFIAHLLAAQYRTYATPRSVNTLGGVLRDINSDLPVDTKVYVVEMGARGEGDIAEITTLVQPHYAVVGKIGPAHIEYFRTLEAIRNTKMEIIQSERLKEAWVHESARIKGAEQIHRFGSDIREVSATLEGTAFVLDGVRYETRVLGAFNAINLAAAIKVAKALGLGEQQIAMGLASLEPVAHRLQRIDAGGKLILDDSFNGNIDGMMASFDLAETHTGRKVLVTPGLVEADEALNAQVAQRASSVFDRVWVTGDLNYPIFRSHVAPEKLVRIADKRELERLLAQETHAGDLILFANDAPNFI
jgi:UDP-N-acetylmuramoyl-tripeptide--D-alanyl-D-alanine ligase